MLVLAKVAAENPVLDGLRNDPLARLDGVFVGLDTRYQAICTQLLASSPRARVGMIWGAVYLPAEACAKPCQITVVWDRHAPSMLSWPAPVFLGEATSDVTQAAQRALRAALQLLTRTSGQRMVFPAPLYVAISGPLASGDSFGLPLALAFFSALTGQPISPAIGATGAIGKHAVEAVSAVGWVSAKAACLAAQDVLLLSLDEISTLAEALPRVFPSITLGIEPSPTGSLPDAGDLAFLAADLADSAELWRLHPGIMPALVADFQALVQQAIAEAAGAVYRGDSGGGEGVRAVFTTVEGACRAALTLRRLVWLYPWPEAVSISTQIGVHFGEAGRTEQGYFGPPPVLAARLMEAAQPGQTLVSDVAFQRLPHSLDGGTLEPLGLHRLRDLSHVVTLYALDAADLPKNPARPRTLTSRRHNLPYALTPLVGRTPEITAIRQGLSPAQNRLVTLTGAGGVGKTRLALQVAAESLDLFPDGVWFISLTEAPREADLIAAIASALEISLPSIEPGRTLIDVLSRRQTLLVLDNAETALGGIAWLSRLLRAAPGVVCLVTSQVVLNLSGEVRFDVPALALTDAVTLFVERARSVSPDFTLTEPDYECLQRLCQTLDGLPLALELAAARVRHLSLTEIESRLSDAFSLLATRNRDVPERQRTLRATLEWSCGQLTEEERRFFAALAVFADPILEDGAAFVTEQDDAYELLAILEERSLLRRDSTGYRMLTMVRAYARTLLTDDQLAYYKSRHARHFASLATVCNEVISTAREPKTFDLLDLQLDNLRSAADTLLQEPPQFGAFLADIAYFLRRRGHWKELDHWTEIALSHTEAFTLNQNANIHFVRALLKRDQKEFELAEELLKATENFVHQDTNKDLLGDIEMTRGLAELKQENYALALQYFESAYSLFDSNNDRRGKIFSLLNQGKIPELTHEDAMAKFDLAFTLTEY